MNDNKINVNINSVKSVYITIFFNDIKLASATGFLVNKEDITYLITNRHVVTGRNNETRECLDKINGSIPNKLKVWLPSEIDEGYGWRNIDIDLYDSDENQTWLEHPTYKEKVDVVAIKLGKYNQTKPFCYYLKSNYKPSITQNLFILGYPFGLDINPTIGKYAIWTTGVVASEPDLDLNINGEQLPAFLVDAKTRQGQSGSPVIYYDSSGLLKNKNAIYKYSQPITIQIGIYSGRINKESDLGYVWKWSLIEEIINSN